MNIERFHNELAMRLGYERIVKDKKMQIFVEESDDPVVTLKVEGGDGICFRVTDNPVDMDVDVHMTPEIKEIVNTIHQVYIDTVNMKF